ncbi:MAG: BCCT family transporter [Lachnospiraceae bacterium]|nr:BCCT family transporter [Lachnospiraceae bacterium]
MGDFMQKKSKSVLIASLIVVAVFVGMGLIAPGALSKGAGVMFTLMTDKFGWLYLWFVFLLVVICVVIGMSPLGKLKLGKKEDKPEFSDFQWFTMMFSGGMGIGLVFYSVAEPMMEYMAPPSAQAGTPEAMYEVMKTVFFHWGVHPWAIYAIVGLIFGYFSFKKDMPFLLSSGLHPLIGNKANGFIGKLVDVCAVFATMFCISTSMGLGASQIAGGMNYIFGVKVGTFFTCAIVAIITLVFTIATVTGLQKGIQAIADIKVWMSVGFMIFIFVFGGAVYIMDLFSNTFGGYLADIIGKSLWMENKGFVSGWTVFYWAWWIAGAAFCGQFVARVSRGRTIRQYVAVVCIIPAFFSLVWLAIYGGAAFNFNDITNGAIVEAVNNDYTTGLFALLKQFPLYTITGPLALILIVFSFLGLANGATFVLAMLTDNGNTEPSKNLRVLWGVLQGAITIVCLIVGGTAVLSTLQTVAIVSAFPFMIAVIIACVGLFKVMIRDAKEEGLMK